MNRLMMSLQVCADTIEQLRKCDVYRFAQTSIRNGVGEQALELIQVNRPELVKEMRDCLNEIHKENEDEANRI